MDLPTQEKIRTLLQRIVKAVDTQSTFVISADYAKLQLLYGAELPIEETPDGYKIPSKYKTTPTQIGRHPHQYFQYVACGLPIASKSEVGLTTIHPHKVDSSKDDISEDSKTLTTLRMLFIKAQLPGALILNDTSTTKKRCRGKPGMANGPIGISIPTAGYFDFVYLAENMDKLRAFADRIELAPPTTEVEVAR